MVSHVTTVIESDEEVIDFMLNQKGEVDFRKILPYHEDLDMGWQLKVSFVAEQVARKIYTGGVLNLDESLSEMDENTYGQLITMLHNKRTYGFYNNLDFARICWGTKWNAYAQEIDPNKSNRVKFKTAGEHPDAVINKLSHRFSWHEIKVEFAHEEIGTKCGYYTLKGGRYNDVKLSPHHYEQTEIEKRMWVEFAFNFLHPDENPKDYGYDDDWKQQEIEDE